VEIHLYNGHFFRGHGRSYRGLGGYRRQGNAVLDFGISEITYGLEPHSPQRPRILYYNLWERASQPNDKCVISRSFHFKIVCIFFILNILPSDNLIRRVCTFFYLFVVFQAPVFGMHIVRNSDVTFLTIGSEFIA